LLVHYTVKTGMKIDLQN